MKKVLLRAFVAGNLGDDLFVKVICERYPMTQFYLVGSSKYFNNYCKITNLKYIIYDNKFCKIYDFFQKLLTLPNKILNKRIFYIPTYMHHLILKYAKNVDINVLVSGSYFINKTNNKRLINERLSLESRYFDYHPYVIGINFGPYVDDSFYISMKSILKKAKLVSFREKYSLDLFKELNNIQMAPDIVLSGKFQNINLINENFVLISVCKYTEDEEKLEYYTNGLSKIIKYLISINKKIVLLGMCEKYGDLSIIKKIIKDNDLNSCIKVVSYPIDDCDNCLSYIKSAEFIIATRYHAMILGWLFHKPVLPIIYSDKMKNVIEDTGKNIQYITCQNINDFKYDIYFEKVFKNINNYINDFDTDIENSNLHFNLLDNILQ